MSKSILIIFFLIGIQSYSQESDRWTGNLEYAEKHLELALKMNGNRSIFKEKLIDNEEAAIQYAELILFDKYDKAMIEFEKPYQIYLIDDYWVIFGTLPKSYRGGVFHIIFDSWNGQVKRLYHTK